MHVRAPAILVAARQHGETASIARIFTQQYGIVAAYVAGGRGRRLRPVLIPGNTIDVQLAARSEAQLPFAKVELLASRGPWLSEPLAASAITWICALTATVLPERQAYPPLYQALGGALDAICQAPAARMWAGALVSYETLLLRELGYGGQDDRPAPLAHGSAEDELATTLAAMDRLAALLEHYLLADRRGDVMAARLRMRELLGRIA